MKKIENQIALCSILRPSKSFFSFLSIKMSSSASAHTFPPIPSEPLTRQIACTDDRVHDYFADVSYDEPVEIFDMEITEKALRSSLPDNIVPHIVLGPTRDGAAFRVMLRPLLNAPIPGVFRLSELSIPETLAWDYVVYDYLCYLHSRMLPAIGLVQRVVFADAAERRAGLYTLLCSYVIK
jgi:hypothetical protein